MITTTYDPETDAMYVYLMPPGTVAAETREVAPNVNLDVDGQGNVIGIEVLHASRRAVSGQPKAA
jgi:uncharacterized protein YuzE